MPGDVSEEIAAYIDASTDSDHVRNLCSVELERIKAPAETVNVATFGPTYLSVSEEFKPLVGWLVLLRHSKRSSEPPKLLVSMAVMGARPHDDRFCRVVAQLLSEARKI